ncbi:MAG: GGDEF domain-containing protein, partial [Terriglobia bacterium]
VTRPTESCCAHWVTRYKKPLMRPDLTKGLQLDADAKLAAQGLRTCFSLPLTSRDRVIGTLSFYGRERNAFTDRDVEILVPLSEQLSIAIENARLYGKVKRQANTDQLTGLYNYGFFQQFLEKELLRAARYKKDLSVVMLDLDGFKNYNDTFGHPAGDVVLKKMAAILLKCVREADIAARYGGDEFVLILPETGVEGARMLTDRIRSQFEHDDHIKKARSEAELGVSIGIAAYPAMAHSKEELIRLADDFLYGSKKIKQHKEIVF